MSFIKLQFQLLNSYEVQGFTVHIVFRIFSLSGTLIFFCARFKMDDSESEDDRNCEDLEDVQIHGSVPNPGENVMLEAKKKKAKNNEKQSNVELERLSVPLESHVSKVAEEAPAIQRAYNGPKMFIESFNR
jgi:hypothetical protein